MRELLSLLPKPSRYTGNEEGAIHKDPASVKLHIGLAFPDMYEVGMSYLGQKILYAIINDRTDWWAERIFTPCQEAGDILRQHNAPLCTLESDTPLTHLDAIGISITHELCYTNVLYLLDLATIPLRTKDRIHPQHDNRQWPIIIAGGGCTMAAEPLAPFVDIMVLGEAEACMPQLLELVTEYKQRKLTRHDLLMAASHIAGVYIPEFFSEFTDASTGTTLLTPIYPHHTKIVRQIIPDMDDAPYPSAQPIPFGAVHNRLALEIGRGCTRGCRFCQAGSIYRPARERSTDNLARLLESCLTSTGFDDVSFLSLSTGDFSALKSLFMQTIDRCTQEQVSVSLPSLRVGSIDDSIMERMAGIRRTGATLAPEAGSQRLRDVINKGITEEQIILHIQKLFEHGWQQVKLYFMIGLPTETDDDLLAIIDLCRKARDAAGPGIKHLQITAAISPFVPKPHTPFQWEAQPSLEEIRRRVGLLLNAIKQEKRIKLRWHEPEVSLLEGIFSRADRRLADVVEEAYRNGAIFTSWMDHFRLAPWLDAMKKYGLKPEDYTRERQVDEALPWDHLISGLSKEFFLRERTKAYKQKTTDDCRYTHCVQCGVCDTKAGSSLLRNSQSTISLLSDELQIANVLNKPQRDQEAHTVALDKYGRVIPRVMPQKSDTGSKNKPPAIAAQLANKAAHLRIWYSKKDDAVYLSQLELQDIFNRAMRRAQLPLAFSQGFHPLPLITFGRAIPVGVSSDCEWLAVYLYEKLPIQPLLEKLNKGLPLGLQVVAIDPLPLPKKDMNATEEAYIVSAKLPQNDMKAFTAAWEKIAQTASIPWERQTKKAIKQIDARACIQSINVQADNTVLLIFDWSTTYVSPVALCLYVLETTGYTLSLQQLHLTKIAQKDQLTQQMVPFAP